MYLFSNPLTLLFFIAQTFFFKADLKLSRIYPLDLCLIISLNPLSLTVIKEVPLESASIAVLGKLSF